MASPGNRHCVICIGALLFPTKQQNSTAKKLKNFQYVTKLTLSTPVRKPPG